MSVLVVLVPPRDRAATAAVAPAEFNWVFSANGASVSQQGRSAATALPRADSVLAVLADADVSWQRVDVPKAPAARLRAALGGVLEDTLLEDEDALHFALEPGAVAGKPAWVAVMQRAWLAAVIAEIERAGVPIERVLPAMWPQDPPSGHFAPAPQGGGQIIQLTLGRGDGVSSLRLAGNLARHWPGLAGAATVRWTAHPAAVAEAERWLEAPVAVLGDAERALQAARSPWNLRQFELAPRHRGTLALREAWRRWNSPGWRPVRLGVAALLALQLVGLNTWAWRLDQAVKGKRDAMSALLQGTYPKVRSVLDAPAQMQRETELLRNAAGKPGEADLEALLAAAAAAWPEGLPPLQAMRFEPGKLSVAATGWNEQQTAGFRQRVQAAGYRAEVNGNQITLSREVRS